MSKAFQDGRQIAQDATLDCDVCIVGAGPIGLTIALEFIETPLNVLVLESGGLDVGTDRDDLSALAEGGYHGPNDHITAHRRFGGNSSEWIQILSAGRLGVRFGEFQAVDFEPREGIANSGWPIRFDDLKPYSRRVAERWNLNPEGFSPKAYTDPDHQPFEGPEHLTTSVYQFPEATLPRQAFRRRIQEAENITVIHDTTAAAIQTSTPSANQATLLARTSRDHSFNITAGRIILAGGAMATTQLLLHSITDQGHALGNAHDVVGRYLMDHPLLHGGELFLKDPNAITRMKLYDNCPRGQYHSQGYLHPTDDLLRAHSDLVNLNMFLLPRRPNQKAGEQESARERRVHDAAVHAKLALQRRHMPEMKDVLRALSGPDIVLKKIYQRLASPYYNIGRGGWSRETGLPDKYNRFDVIQYAEQLPHADNRLFLGGDEDSVGMKRINFDFKLHQDDIIRFKRTQRVMADSIQQSGQGHVALALPDKDDEVEVIAYTLGHYIGTTRMGDDPRTSVVDANCRVHGSESVYVASTSVFPTGGTSNPTLTALALGLRVADTIKQELKT